MAFFFIIFRGAMYGARKLSENRVATTGALADAIERAKELTSYEQRLAARIIPRFSIAELSHLTTAQLEKRVQG